MDNNFNYSAVKSYHQTTEFIFLLLLCLTSADCFRNLKVVENRFSKQRKSINYIRNTFYSKSNLAMWAFSAVPEKMLMIIAIIFGGHLLPFSWLYKSKVYLIYSILISAISFIIGMICSRQLLALIMILVEITFAFSLYKENIGENRVKK